MHFFRTLTLATVLTGLAVAPAMAQQERDRDAERDALVYEFEFAYDADELRDTRTRTDMDRRLRTSANEYCTQNMRDHRAACRREVVRAVQDDFDRLERRRAEIYAAREE